MTTYVGAEYVIANALIAASEKGQDCISFSQIEDIGQKTQRECDKMKIDTRVYTSERAIITAIDEYPNYFEYVEVEKNPMVRMKKEASVSQLQEQFGAYLPPKIMKTLVKNVKCEV